MRKEKEVNHDNLFGNFFFKKRRWDVLHLGGHCNPTQSPFLEGWVGWGLPSMCYSYSSATLTSLVCCCAAAWRGLITLGGGGGEGANIWPLCYNFPTSNWFLCTRCFHQKWINDRFVDEGASSSPSQRLSVQSGKLVVLEIKHEHN